MRNNQSPAWHLSHITIKTLEDDSGERTKISRIEEVDVSEFERARDEISEYHKSLQLIESVWSNVQDFLSAIVAYTKDYHDTRSMEEEKMDKVSTDLMRLLLNVLSMFRSFLDHSNASISRKYGESSEELLTWKQAQSDKFDSVFEYRLLYKLRNYCQHVGMPPLSITFSESVDSEGIGFGLSLSRNSLLKESSIWGSKVAQDLRDQEDHILVLDALNAWSESFWALAECLMRIKQKSALWAADYIVSHRSNHGIPAEDGQICLIQFPSDEVTEGRLNLQIRWLSEDKARQILSRKPFWPRPGEATE